MKAETRNGKKKINMIRKCEVCGKQLENGQSTHCSEDCLFKSIEKSKPFMPESKDNNLSKQKF